MSYRDKDYRVTPYGTITLGLYTCDQCGYTVCSEQTDKDQWLFLERQCNWSEMKAVPVLHFCCQTCALSYLDEHNIPLATPKEKREG